MVGEPGMGSSVNLGDSHGHIASHHTGSDDLVLDYLACINVAKRAAVFPGAYHIPDHN